MNQLTTEISIDKLIAKQPLEKLTEDNLYNPVGCTNCNECEYAIDCTGHEGCI